MKRLSIAGKELFVKDYYCAYEDEQYLPNERPAMWLYINLTDQCPANCPFCVNPSGRVCGEPFSFDKLSSALLRILPAISGVSITGGEPLVDVPRFRELMKLLQKILPSDLEVDLVTNGAELEALAQMPEIERLTSIHISRHAVDDELNRRLMQWHAPSVEEIAAFVRSVPDPSGVAFNCVLQKGGVASAEDVAGYLEMAAAIGVRNTSFVGMFAANLYCREAYISPGSLELEHDLRFRIWSRFHDHGYCQCCNGDYLSPNGPTRFYYRWPGAACNNYVRQLVYTADNHLLAGFGGNTIL